VLVGPTAEVASTAAKDFQATSLILFRCVPYPFSLIENKLKMELDMFTEQTQNVQKIPTLSRKR